MRNPLVRIVAVLIQVALVAIAYHLMGKVVARLFDLRSRRYRRLTQVVMILPTRHELAGPNADS